MKYRSGGFINPVLAVASAGLLALVAAIVVINPSLPSPFGQASVTRRNVRLVKNTADARFVRNSDGTINTRKINLTGDFCFAQHSNTGSENWTIWASRDSAGRDRFTQGGSSADIDNGTLDTGGGYPAPCEGFDPQTGEAELNNLGVLQPHTFSLQLMFPHDLTETSCPDVLMHYESNRQGGRAFGRISLKNIEGLCAPVPTATLTPGPTTTLPTATPQPTQTANPTATPTPDSRPAITGTIRVYSCTKPDFVKLYRCGKADSAETLCSSLRYNQADEAQPQDNYVWLDDQNSDNTWIYRYRITKDSTGTDIQAGAMYRLAEDNARNSPAQALFGTTTYYNNRESLASLQVTAPGIRDFAIDATRTCANSCSFHAVASIKDENGRPISKLDNKPGQWGAANEKQRTQKADGPDAASPFGHNGKPGQIEYGPTQLDSLNPLGFGRDALATSKLFVPDNFQVIRQECTSKGSVDACPNDLPKTTFSDGDKPKEIDGLRVTCGTDVEYGWILKENPLTPTPPPSGNGDMEVRVVIYNKNDASHKFWPQSSLASTEPQSCERLRTPDDPNAQERPIYISTFKIKARCVTCSGGVEFNEAADKREGHLSFHNIPSGEYELTLSGIGGRGFRTWQGCVSKRWTVRPGGSVGNNRTHTRAYIILENQNDEEYDRENTEKICKDQGGSPNIIEGMRGNYCYYPDGKQEDTGGGEGGSDAGGCWPPNERKCTGPVAGNFSSPSDVCSAKGQDDAGNRYTSGYGWCGEGNNACCNINESSGGGDEPDPTSAPGEETPLPPGSTTNPRSCPAGYSAPSSGPYASCDACDDRSCQSAQGGSQYGYCCQASNLGSCTPTQYWDGPFSSSEACYDDKYRAYKHASGGDGFCCRKKNTGPSPTATLPTARPVNTRQPTQEPVSCTTAPGHHGVYPDEDTCRDVCRRTDSECKKTSNERGGNWTCCLKPTPPPEPSSPPSNVCACNRPVCSGSCQGTQGFACTRNLDCTDTSNSPYCEYNGVPESDIPNRCVDDWEILVEGSLTCRSKETYDSYDCCAAGYHPESRGYGTNKCVKNGQNFSSNSADINNDGVVNTFDYAIMIDSYGLQALDLTDESTGADINSDGVVNALDVSYVIDYFGEEVR